jgi:hypothetical protein
MSRQDNEDPTPFSTVHFDYNKRVHALLTTDTFPGLTTLQLTTFKALYGPYAFICRYSGCSKTSLGFSSDKLRVQHEKSHAPPLLCTHPGCTYTLRFQSLHGLKRHLRENHSELIRTVPKSIRHKSIANTAQSSTPSAALPSTIATMTEALDSIIQPQYHTMPQIVASVAPVPTCEIRRSLTCLWCHRIFGSLGALQDHMVESHYYSRDLKAKKLCAFCNREGLSTTVEYYRHLGLYHSENPEAVDYHAHLSCLRRIRGTGTFSKINFEEDIMERLQLTTTIRMGSYGSTVRDKRHNFLFNRAYIQCLKRVFPSIGSVDLNTTTAFITLENYYISSAFLVAKMDQFSEDPGSVFWDIGSGATVDLMCFWCPRLFKSLSKVQDHQIETHEFVVRLDPTILCDYCFRSHNQQFPFRTLHAYLAHLEQIHSGSPLATIQAIQHEAHLSCVLQFNNEELFTDVTYDIVKDKHQRNLGSLKILLDNSADDDKLKILRDILFNEACVETLDRLRPRLFRTIDASASVASRDARPLVYVDLLNSMLNQNTNDNTAKGGTG